MSLRIVTDSACDLPTHIVEEYDIHVLPFLVYLEGRERVDGVDITPEEVYAAIRADKVPTTGQVPLETFLTVFTEYAREGTPCSTIFLQALRHLQHRPPSSPEVKRA